MSGDLDVSNFRDVLRGISENPTTEIVAGYVTLVNNAWTVLVRGVALPAIWLGSCRPAEGASCMVAVTHIAGESTAWVLGMTFAAPPPDHEVTVTVVPSGGTTATVTALGVSYTAYRLSSYAPTVGDKALVTWIDGDPYLLGAITKAAKEVTKTAPPPPPRAATSGYSTFPIRDSGTFTQGYNWNGYFGQHTYSGSGYVPPSSGNWFYGGATRALADKTTITRVRFYLGSRRRAGAYNSAATVHFYVHNANVRGSGEPARISGPFDKTVAAGWGGGYIDLPVSVGTDLKSGGGISIAGDPYVGFTAGAQQPAAGTLLVNWRKA